MDSEDDVRQKTFSELWKWVSDRSQRGVMTVQEPTELEHIFNLMRECDCGSYLEIGTAEGNSLYVLGQATKNASFIDLGEPHTFEARKMVTDYLAENWRTPAQYIGDSTDPFLLPKNYQYECILIDGGHDFATVLSDSILYAPLATKYVFWHDIQLPEVKAAYKWFKKRWPLGEYSEFISSETMGYGICKVKQ